MSINEQRVRPLRKQTLDGTQYCRRRHVEAELEALAKLPLHDLKERLQLGSKDSVGFVSSEAVVHLVRTAAPRSSHYDGLIAVLLERLHRRLRPSADNGSTASHSLELIRDQVRDGFVDLLLADRDSYEDRLDYYEVSFDGAVAKDRLDVQRRVYALENRSKLLGPEDEAQGLHPKVDAAVETYDPFADERLDEMAYRQRLQAAIDVLPPLQQEIVHMLAQGIPIDSNDPNTLTISNVLDKAEKTIRSHRDKAFAFLRVRLTRWEH